MEIYLCYEEGDEGVDLMKIFDSHAKALAWIMRHNGYYRWFEVHVVE